MQRSIRRGAHNTTKTVCAQETKDERLLTKTDQKHKNMADIKQEHLDLVQRLGIGAEDGTPILPADGNEAAWDAKYLQPAVRSKMYDLVATDLGVDGAVGIPCFTETFCREIIAMAESVEWTTDRHDFYPTTDNLLQVLGMDTIYSDVIRVYLHPMLQSLFGWENPASKTTFESFIVKYDPAKQAHLDLHHDDSIYSIVVTLNTDFTGGGTWFINHGTHVEMPMGTAVIHPGGYTHRHAGAPTLSGTRYIIVTFARKATS